MDPNANWLEATNIARQLADEESNDYDLEEVAALSLRLSELVMSLDDWVRSGGFVPEPFRRG